MRAFWALLLAVAGIGILFSRNFEFWLSGAGCYFREPEHLSDEQRARLARTMAERREAEGSSQSWTRFLGIATLVLAALQLLPAVPYAMPYAIFALCLAAAKLARYTRIRRASQQRAAALVPRSPLHAFRPFLFPILGCALVGILVLAPVSQLRPAVLVVAIATAVLGWIAWQIASGRALLFGQDPKMEYAVDERVREGRVMDLALLACAPALALAAPSAGLIPSAYHTLGDLAWWLTLAAFIGAALALYLMRRSAAGKFERDIA